MPCHRVWDDSDLTNDTEELRDQLQNGARIRATKLTEQFGPAEYSKQHQDQARPLFLVTSDKKLQVVTTDSPAVLKVGLTVLGLVPRDLEQSTPTADIDEPDIDKAEGQ